MPWLLIAFIVVPAIELALLIEIGSQIGALATFALICFTGIVGAALAKQQGASALQALRSDLQSGQVPAKSLVNAALVFSAGLLLLTPGLLTDIVGFSLLVPAVRNVARAIAAKRAEAWLKTRTVVHSHPARPRATPGQVIIDLPAEEDR